MTIEITSAILGMEASWTSMTGCPHPIWSLNGHLMNEDHAPFGLNREMEAGCLNVRP